MDDLHAATNNWGVIGHEWAVGFLQGSLLNGRQRHAYLITGAPALGKMTLARAFARALNCEHAEAAARPCGGCRACASISRANDPDLIIAQSEEGAPLKIGDIRSVTRKLALRPYAARYRIAIFPDFDLVAPLAQDALLKTLEEPAAYAVLILLASFTGGILPTILSRAQLAPLRPIKSALIKAELVKRGCEPERADLLARLSSGRLGWALAALEDEAALALRAERLDSLHKIVAGTRLTRLRMTEKLSKQIGRDKALLRAMLETWQIYWRDVLLECWGSPVKLCNVDRLAEIRALAGRIETGQALRALQVTRHAIAGAQTNANIRLALDALALEYPGLD